MNNDIFMNLLNKIMEEKESFDMLIDADNILGLNVSSEDIINFLEFNNSSELLSNSIVGNIIITEGDILSILKLIHDLVYYEGEYILYINNDNIGTITYLVSRANQIYKNFNIDVSITIDYSDNYNKHLDEQVTILGSSNFVNTAYADFKKYHLIVV